MLGTILNILTPFVIGGLVGCGIIKLLKTLFGR